MLGRYFYFEANGSDKSEYTHYVEIQIVDKDGVNRALGRGLLRYSGTSTGEPSVVVDGSTDVTNYFTQNGGARHIVIDLGAVYDISYIKIWRYYGDERVYKDIFVKVSTDDIDYTTVFSSAENGLYPETAVGKFINLRTVEQTQVKYVINSTSLIAIADEVRRITGIAELLTIEEMITKLRTIPVQE